VLFREINIVVHMLACTPAKKSGVISLLPGDKGISRKPGATNAAKYICHNCTTVSPFGIVCGCALLYLCGVDSFAYSRYDKHPHPKFMHGVLVCQIHYMDKV